MDEIAGEPTTNVIERAADAVSAVSGTESAQVSQGTVACLHAEVLLGNHQVSGEIQPPGVSRRLVDLLNALDSYLIMHAGVISDGSETQRQFDTIQIVRDSIRLAFPREGSRSRADAGELIEKDKRLVSIVLQGCEVNGYYHAPPGIDPSAATTGTARQRFLPLTHSTVTVFSGNNPRTFFEPVVLVNTAHAQAYVWSDDTESPTAPADAE